MKKVLFLINSLHGGGAENVVNRLSHTLVKMGHKVHLFLLYNDIDYDIDKKNISVTILQGKNHKEKAIYFDNKLDKIEQKQGRIDAIYAFLLGAHIVAKYSKRSNIYMSIRNYESEKLKEQSYLNYLKKIFKFRKLYNNENILTVCNAVQDDLHKNFYVQPKSIQTIYNPYDFNELRKKVDEDVIDHIENKFILLIGSFNNKQKRQDIAIKLMQSIDQDFDLVLLGKGKRIEHYKRLAKRLNVDHRVHFKGWASNPYPWMKKASVVLITSDYEGFPNVLVESLVVGTPVVCRESSSGINEILVKEWAQYIVKDDKGFKSLAMTVNRVAKEGYTIDKKLYAPFACEDIAQQYINLIARK